MREIRRSAMAVGVVALLFSGGAAFSGRSASTNNSKAARAGRTFTAHVKSAAVPKPAPTPEVCAAVGFWLDKAIARGTGAGRIALEHSESLILNRIGCPGEPG